MRQSRALRPRTRRRRGASSSAATMGARMTAAASAHGAAARRATSTASGARSIGAAARTASVTGPTRVGSSTNRTGLALTALGMSETRSQTTLHKHNRVRGLTLIATRRAYFYYGSRQQETAKTRSCVWIGCSGILPSARLPAAGPGPENFVLFPLSGSLRLGRRLQKQNATRQCPLKRDPNFP